LLGGSSKFLNTLGASLIQSKDKHVIGSVTSERHGQNVYISSERLIKEHPLKLSQRKSS